METETLSSKIKVIPKITIDKAKPFVRLNSTDNHVLNRAIWLERDDAEISKDYVQVIPVSVIRSNDGKIFVFNRSESDNFLNKKLSLVVGGHQHEPETYEGALRRELLEEIQIEPRNINLLGFVVEHSTIAISPHIALLYETYADSVDINTDEFTSHYEKQDIRYLKNNKDKFDYWSKIIIDKVLNE